MSAGPKTISQQFCATLELKDLSDVIEFDLPSEEGAVFGFEVTANGKYKRKAIEEKKSFKLGQLRDVNVPDDLVDDKKYELTRQSNKWVITLIPEPPIQWDISFKMISPYVLTEDERILRKVMNSGPLLVSLVPFSTNRDNIRLLEQKDRKYSLTLVDHSKTGFLSFTPSYNIREEATMVFEFTLNSIERVPDDGFSLMQGIAIRIDKDKLKAKGTTTHDRVYVMITKKGTQQNVYSSLSDALIVDVETAGLAVIKSINLSHISLVSFRFANKMYDTSILETELI